MLMFRKKNHDEPVQEYVLTYVDDTSNRVTVLYGTRDFSEFKDQVKWYERIPNKTSLINRHPAKIKTDFDEKGPEDFGEKECKKLL